MPLFITISKVNFIPFLSFSFLLWLVLFLCESCSFRLSHSVRISRYLQLFIIVFVDYVEVDAVIDLPRQNYRLFHFRMNKYMNNICNQNRATAPAICNQVVSFWIIYLLDFTIIYCYSGSVPATNWIGIFLIEIFFNFLSFLPLL